MNLHSEQGGVQGREGRWTYIRESGHPETEAEAEDPRGFRSCHHIGVDVPLQCLGVQGDPNNTN